jgi:hypothetical protein
MTGYKNTKLNQNGCFRHKRTDTDQESRLDFYIVILSYLYLFVGNITLFVLADKEEEMKRGTK